MSKIDLKRVFSAAKTMMFDNTIDVAAPLEGIAIWEGKRKRSVTLRATAAFLRWQCLRFNGSWDEEALSCCFSLLQRRTVLVD
jgi:hypothetical protein